VNDHSSPPSSATVSSSASWNAVSHDSSSSSSGASKPSWSPLSSTARSATGSAKQLHTRPSTCCSRTRPSASKLVFTCSGGQVHPSLPPPPGAQRASHRRAAVASGRSHASSSSPLCQAVTRAGSSSWTHQPSSRCAGSALNASASTYGTIHVPASPLSSIV
jgi:hypothetical protein